MKKDLLIYSVAMFICELLLASYNGYRHDCFLFTLHFIALIFWVYILSLQIKKITKQWYRNL